MKKRRIEPGWRYTAAQFTLRLLFGRKWHYISPWKHAKVAAIVIFYRDDKVLLSLRAGHIEKSGSWGFIGGHLNLEHYETISEALNREIEEETGLTLPPNTFSNTQPYRTLLTHHFTMLEQEDVTGFTQYYLYKLSAAEEATMAPADETAELRWFTEEEIETLAQNNQMAFTEHLNSIRAFFKQAQT